LLFGSFLFHSAFGAGFAQAAWCRQGPDIAEEAIATAAMTSGSVAELKDERRHVFEELSVALEAISAKSLLEFRSRVEVPRPVQSVAVACVCMVARVDDNVDVDSDGLPLKTWEAAQASMAKPGHFINSLRQFPFAVDSGRMPENNVYTARQCMEDVSPEHLADEPIALALYDWIRTAWQYSEVVQMLRLQSQVTSPQTGPAASTGASVVMFGGRPAQDSAPRGTPPSSPEQLKASGDTPGKPMRSSLGSSGGGSNSVFGRSPIADPSPGGESTRSSRPSGGRGGGQASGGGRGMPARRPNTVPSGYAPRRSGGQDSTALSLTPSNSPHSPVSTRSPPSQRASPSHPSTQPRPRPTSGGRAGYTGYKAEPAPAPRSNVGIEDWKQQLEQMRREAREMRSMDSDLKWRMKREEDKQRNNEAKEDTKDLMEWRKEQKIQQQEYGKTRAEKHKREALEESKDFQDFKHVAKQVELANELEKSKELCLVDKEYSEWMAESNNGKHREERQNTVDMHLEQYALASTYKIEEAQREKIERKIARMEDEEAELGFAMLEARREREAAIQSLEHVKKLERTPVNGALHIASRPILPGNQCN